MSKESNLEIEVKRQAKSLDPAQREFVIAELKTFVWNRRKIHDLERQIESGELKRAEEKSVVAERHQLVSENAQLFTHMMRHLKDTESEVSAIEEFM